MYPLVWNFSRNHWWPPGHLAMATYWFPKASTHESRGCDIIFTFSLTTCVDRYLNYWLNIGILLSAVYINLFKYRKDHSLARKKTLIWRKYRRNGIGHILLWYDGAYDIRFTNNLKNQQFVFYLKWNRRKFLMCFRLLTFDCIETFHNFI